MKKLVLGLAFAVAGPAAAQGGTDIWLAPLKIESGRAVLGTARNFTDRPGYDNQPSWAARGDVIFFSSLRGDGQNDIWAKEVVSGKETRVTTSAPESEYSPTMMPSGTSLSVVRVEADSTQRLWRVPLNGNPPAVLVRDVKPVGYHAWVDAETLALFVLADRAAGVPSTLRIVDTRGGAPVFAARDIGRGIAKIPNASAVAFIQRDSADGPWIMRYDVPSKRLTRIVRPLEGSQDFAYTPAGRLLMAKDFEVFELVGLEWKSVANFSAQAIQGISRLAVSPNGDQVAFVALDKTP